MAVEEADGVERAPAVEQRGQNGQFRRDMVVRQPVQRRQAQFRFQAGAPAQQGGGGLVPQVLLQPRTFGRTGPQPAIDVDGGEIGDQRGEAAAGDPVRQIAHHLVHQGGGLLGVVAVERQRTAADRVAPQGLQQGGGRFFGMQADEKTQALG